MVSSAKRGSTPLDSPKGERGIISVVYTVNRRVSERSSPQILMKGVKEGRSPSYYIVPFPSGEGDTGDRAYTGKKG